MATLASRRRNAHRAFAQLLQALGAPTGAGWKQTPKRAANLWVDQLLAGEAVNVRSIVSKSVLCRNPGPVCVTHMGVHVVCPHHLTVAFGMAHVAYYPAARLLGFGAISALVRACTARFVLQEEAARDISEALVQHLPATAAVTLIEAEHPCHNLTNPRSHSAKAATLGLAGDSRSSRALRALLQNALRNKKS